MASLNSAQQYINDINNRNTPNNSNSILTSDDNNVIYTRRSLGYAKGYSQYFKKSGGPIGPNDEREKRITIGDEVEYKKDADQPIFIDNHTNKFRNINGYSSNNLDHQDPTHLIFDINIDEDSPLFREDIILRFLNEYATVVPEIGERVVLWREFVNKFFTIFPRNIAGSDSGSKRHYITGLGGLDVLTKPIIDYPNEKITISISEDVTMTLLYLSELYNNLTYSYDTHRYMIPDNLLRFNLRITIKDIRNFKIVDNDNKSVFNDEKSKMIYILHDCQLNFMSTKNFTNDMTRGGFGAASPGISAGGVFEIFFKSYSKIMAPLMIDNSIILDFKEREGQNREFYKEDKDGDFRSRFEYETELRKRETIRNINYRTVGLTPAIEIPQSSTDERSVFRRFTDRWKNLVIEEFYETRNVILKNLHKEVSILRDRAQRFLGDEFGFTIGKVNVYYDSLEEKVTKFSFMFESFLNNESSRLKDKYLNNSDNDFLKSIYNTRSGQYNQKFPGELNLQPELPPRQITIREDNLHDKGQYNQKFPEGDKHENGQYNQKFPEGDVHPDGTYNEKYPDGDLHDDGKYNEKYPDGDVHPDGTYNQKFPDGDLHPDGTYNEKYPDGDLHEDGKYNEKYPDGDLHEDGRYNEKYPEGKLHNSGTYNEKYPEGDVHPDATYNEKYPEGKLYDNGTYNEKYPEGDKHDDGQYNQKFPDGELHEDGQYNQKFPDGDVHPDGVYNEKYPDGKLHDSGSYNEKQPDGDLHEDSTYNRKYPDGNLHGKKLPPNFPTDLGNVNRK